jgi:alpha-amylase
MALLNHAGLVRNNTGNSLPGSSVVTFVDNHDTGKEHDKWVTRDYKMAYAYILTHEGTPCIFYPHYFGIVQHDAGNGLLTVDAGKELQAIIKKLISIRKNYLDGEVSVLSETGSPVPQEDTHNVYIARRQGSTGKSGGIVVINNNDKNPKGLWVNSSPSGFKNLAGKVLVNVFNIKEKITVQPDGRVYLSAPSRDFSLWVPADEYLTD